MKAIILMTLAVLAAHRLEAQTKDSVDCASFTVVYDYAVKATDAEGHAVTDAMQLAVQVGSDVTKSFSYNDYLRQTEDQWDTSIAYGEAFIHQPTVWLNHKAGHVVTREVIFPNTFESEAPVHAIDWTLQDDTLTIGRYLCHAAKGSFAGLEWRVWYTDEVPTTAGPWKLYGLPGLIIGATDADSVHSFTFNGLMTSPTPIIYKSEPAAHKMDNRKLVRYRNTIYCNKQYAQNPTYYIPDLSSQIQNMGVFVFNMGSASRVMVDGCFLLEKSHVFKPLELE